MKTAIPLTVARYAGIGLAICVPAILVAQAPLPGFGDNQVLRGADLRLLRDAVATARDNITRLQTTAIQKALIHQVTAVVAAPPNATPSVVASCDDTEIMLHCGCRGLASATDPDHLNGANSTGMDLRMVLLRNPTTTPDCICQAQNSGTNASAGLVAIATCVPVQ
jgi:hypothetical protein